jgi:hypothetical protein
MALKFPNAQQIVAEHNALLVEKNLEPKIDAIVDALRQYGSVRVFLCKRLYLPEIEKESVRIETADPSTAARLIIDEAKAAGYLIRFSITYTDGTAAVVLHLPSDKENELE